MLGVSASNKHRYFRIQVAVTVCISMVVYFLVLNRIIPSNLHSSPILSIGIEFFRLGPVLAASVLCYFVFGQLRLWTVIGASLLLYGVVILWAARIAGDETAASFEHQQNLYFATINLLGFIILGGFTAWLGKLIGILTLAAFVFSISTGDSNILVFTPVLALLDITNIYAQWTIAIVVTVSSFLADR